MVDKRTSYYRTSRVVLRDAYRIVLVMIFIACLFPVINSFFKPEDLLNPLVSAQEARPAPTMTPAPTKPPEPDDIQKTDKWVGQYVDKYFTSHYGRSRIRGVMHCLLIKESQHTFMTAHDHHGDNGMAGGILQYWPATWTGFRKIMMDRGLVTEIGSRYNPEQAIETTVWALSDGRERNWGPINVGACLDTKGSR